MIPVCSHNQLSLETFVYFPKVVDFFYIISMKEFNNKYLLNSETKNDLLRSYAPIFLGRTVPPGKAGKMLKSPVSTPSRSKTTAHHKQYKSEP